VIDGLKRHTYMTREKEITEPTDLCDAKGNLLPASVGWARHPIFRCNVTGHPLRKKKWNYWCIASPDLLFSATISNLDYAAVMFVYALDLKTFAYHEETVLAPFGAGCRMPDAVDASVRYEGKSMSIVLDCESGVTRMKVRCDRFGGGTLHADVTIRRPADHETLNVVVPWSANRFQYTSKMNCLPAEGSVQWGDKKYAMQAHEAFACLDFGRGVWKYKSSWNWASASGMQNGRAVGITFGGQWTDGTGVTENGIVVDGRLSKIGEDIVWSYNKMRYMDAWTLTTAQTDRVALTFEPLYERVAATKAVIIASEVHQMIGRFSGHVVTDDGEHVAIDGMLGWAEDHHARW